MLEIKGYEGLYKITPDGRVWSARSGRLLKNIKIPRGYQVIFLVNQNKKVRRHFIHRLVAKAFIQNPKKLNCVNHLNANTADNRVENLEWCDRKSNAAHAKSLGLYLRGEESPSAKLTSDKVRDLRKKRSEGMSYAKLGRLFGISDVTALKIVRKEKWSHID